MKKTAVLLYDTCCLFELTVALEMLKRAGKPVEYFSKSLSPIRTEEGMLVIADELIENISINDFDSILITGAQDAREAVEDSEILLFIEKFYKADAVIGAISIILDLHTQKIVGYDFSKSMDTSSVLRALDNAITTQKPAKGLIIHSDRGSQYTSKEYRKTIVSKSFQLSYSDKGCPYDNACIESFHAILKKNVYTLILL